MFEAVKEALVDSLNIDENDIELTSSLKEDLDIDSIDAVELSLDLEEKFDVELTDEELAALKTVEDIVKLIESKKAK
jgi:acyl carrier protein